MRRLTTCSRLVGPLVLTSAFALLGCAAKPSCKQLYERLTKCAKSGTWATNEQRFLEVCEKNKEKPASRAEILCSKETECGPFNACLAKAREQGARALLEKRWKEVEGDLAEGKFTRPLVFCDIRKADLPPDLHAKCEALPRRAVAELTRRIIEARDQGKVPLEGVSCWDLKKLATRVDEAAKKAASDLCVEIMVANQLRETRDAVTRHIGMPRPFLPYHCHPPRFAEAVRKVKSAYTEKARQEMISLCFVKLGKVIFEKRVPDQTRCEVRDLYQAVKTLGFKDPGIDPWMEKAKVLCEAGASDGSAPAPGSGMAPAGMAPAGMAPTR